MSDETKHTPGPWCAWRPIGEEWAVTENKHDGVMPMRIANEIDREADARLIATAPELLAALKDCEEALHLATTPLPEDREEVFSAQRKARAAIKRAEGRS